MNRKQRRAGAKAGAGPESAQPEVVVRPGWGLRLFAPLLLSDFVLRRVRDPMMIAALKDVARQTGRSDIVEKLSRR